MTSRPHDALFKSAFEAPADAARLLRELLPSAVRDAIAWSTLRREHGSFIDRELADRHSDLLFHVRLRSGRSRNAFLLLEHQSTADSSMPLRSLAYQLQIWNRCRKERRRSRDYLPPVLAVLVSHVPGGWMGPRAFEEMFDPAVLALPGIDRLIPRCSMPVMDLARLSNTDLLAMPLPAFQKLALWLLRDARAPERLLANFDTWSSLLRAAGRARAGLDALETLIVYMFRVVHPRYQDELRAKLLALGPSTQEATMTIADVLRKEGFASGRVEALRRQLVFKFRTLDAASEARLKDATPREIDHYLRRVLTADSLAEVFEGNPRRRSGAPRSRGPRAHAAR